MSWDTGGGYVKVAMRVNSLVTVFLLLKSSCNFVSHGCICYYVAFDLLIVFVIQFLQFWDTQSCHLGGLEAPFWDPGALF